MPPFQKRPQFFQAGRVDGVPVVVDGHGHDPAFHGNGDVNVQSRPLAEAVGNGVLDDRLEHQLRHHAVHRFRGDGRRPAEAFPEAVVQYDKVLLGILPVLSQAGQRVGAADGVAEDVRQDYDHLPGGRRVGGDHVFDGFQGVEQKMGVELDFQLLDLGKHGLAADLFVELHLPFQLEQHAVVFFGKELEFVPAVHIQPPGQVPVANVFHRKHHIVQHAGFAPGEAPGGQKQQGRQQHGGGQKQRPDAEKYRVEVSRVRQGVDLHLPVQDAPAGDIVGPPVHGHLLRAAAYVRQRLAVVQKLLAQGTRIQVAHGVRQGVGHRSGAQQPAVERLPGQVEQNIADDLAVLRHRAANAHVVVRLRGGDAGLDQNVFRALLQVFRQHRAQKLRRLKIVGQFVHRGKHDVAAGVQHIAVRAQAAPVAHLIHLGVGMRRGGLPIRRKEFADVRQLRQDVHSLFLSAQFLFQLLRQKPVALVVVLVDRIKKGAADQRIADQQQGQYRRKRIDKKGFAYIVPIPFIAFSHGGPRPSRSSKMSRGIGHGLVARLLCPGFYANISQVRYQPSAARKV